MSPAVAIPALITAAITAVGGYLVASRRLSGKIATSEASDLWAESRSIRDDYRDRLAKADDRIFELSGRLERQEALSNDCLRDNIKLIARIQDLEADVERLGGAPPA